MFREEKEGMMMLYKEKFCDTKSFVGPTKEETLDFVGQKHPC
jgi:hypothetical protein